MFDQAKLTCDEKYAAALDAVSQDAAAEVSLRQAEAHEDQTSTARVAAVHELDVAREALIAAITSHYQV